MLRASRSMHAFLALIVLLIPASASAQDWYELYDNGVRLVNKGQYIEAEPLLLRAKTLAAKMGKQPGPVVLFYGNRREPFFPDFYLGKIYVNTKRAKEAITAFDLARSQKLPAGRPEFREIDSLVARANDDARVTANVARGPDPAAGRGPTPVEPSPPVDPRGADRKQFLGLTQTAIQQLKQGNFAEARRAAQSAKDLNFDNPRADDILKDITASEAKVAEDKRVNDAAIAEKERLTAEKERLTTINNLATQVDAALKVRDLGKAKTALNSLTAAASDDPRLADFRNRVGALETTLVLNTAERTAMQAFFAKDFQKALNTINEAEQKTRGQLSPRAYLYRACSIAAIALQGKSPNQNSLNLARQQFKQAQQGRAQFAKDLEYISPRIRKEIGAS